MSKDILAKLKDDAEYYGGIGKNYLSNSDIGTLLQNPAAFGQTRPDSKELMGGRYFHHMMLEPHKAEGTPFVDVSTRNTKEYKNYCETYNMEFVMLKKEVEEIDWIVGTMKSNITFFDDVYHPDNQFEVPAVGEIFGVPFKGKCDIVTHSGLEHNIDLKTTSDILKFRKSAYLYNYDSQDFIYYTLFGKRLAFYVADKTTGQLGIFKGGDDFLRSGEEKVKRAVEVWKKYFGPNPTDDIANHYILADL